MSDNQGKYFRSAAKAIQSQYEFRQNVQELVDYSKKAKLKMKMIKTKVFILMQELDNGDQFWHP